MHRLAGPEHRPGPDQLGGERPAEDLARAGRLLQPGGHIHGVADHGAVAGSPDGGGHHLPRVDADREDQIAAELPHGQGGGHRSLGVVVMGDGDPEDGHQAVTHVLVDGAAVIDHDRAELAEGGIDHPGHDLGVGPLGQGGEADHVGEQHRRQLAFLDRLDP